jgi:hypothetical protein
VLCKLKEKCEQYDYAFICQPMKIKGKLVDERKFLYTTSLANAFPMPSDAPVITILIT